MSDRQSIIGFTEAELGFFLALLCLILFVSAASNAEEDLDPPPPPPADQVTISEDSLRHLHLELAALHDEIDSLASVIDTLRHRRSRITPSCTERGLATGPLFTVTIIAPDRFRVDGKDLGIAELLSTTAPERQVAQRIGCIHQIRVQYVESLSATELDAGWRKLDPGFRLIRAGVVPE